MKIPRLINPRATFVASLSACVALALLTPAIQAEVLVLFDGEQTPFDNTPGGAFANFANVGGNTGFDPGGNSAAMTDYGITLVDAVDSPFGTGNAMRFFDLAPDEKPEVQGEFGSFDMADPPVFTNAPLLEPFRIDIDSNNRAPVTDLTDPDGNHAIRFRMSNAGASISSESRSAFSISYQANGRLTAKYSGIADNDGGDPPVHTPDPNDVDTLSTDVLTGPSTMTMVANGGLTEQYTYTLFGQTRTIDPLHYDIYVDGALLNTHPENPMTDVENAQVTDRQNGLQFHTEKSFGNYIPANGIGRIGLIGSSNADTLPDYDFDNIVLRTGADIEASATVPGDFTGDGIVDDADIDALSANLGLAAGAAADPAMDVVADGTIDLADHDAHINTLVQDANGTGALIGDLNFDGDVDVSQISFVGGIPVNVGDASVLLANLGTETGATYAQGDLNGDGDVDVSQISFVGGVPVNVGDASRLLANLGQNTAGAAPAASAVPEPGSLSLLALAGLGAAIRRRK